ncbi:MAG: hypothetical protein IPJ30_07040 [Acidobacteria bacterium]|nr:hypothetical protein [Acidobacteriota bacterium]
MEATVPSTTTAIAGSIRRIRVFPASVPALGGFESDDQHLRQSVYKRAGLYIRRRRERFDRRRGAEFLLRRREQAERSENASNQTIGLYYFDGDGRRVKKVTATETVIFVFDAAGKLVAEYSTSPSQTPQVQYLTNDHLGTPRINTNENGAVVSRTDYMPYGEEIIGPRQIDDRQIRRRRRPPGLHRLSLTDEETGSTTLRRECTRRNWGDSWELIRFEIQSPSLEPQLHNLCLRRKQPDECI